MSEQLDLFFSQSTLIVAQSLYISSQLYVCSKAKAAALVTRCSSCALHTRGGKQRDTGRRASQMHVLNQGFFSDRWLMAQLQILPHASAESVALIKRILVYRPKLRLCNTPLLMDPFFDELFIPDKRRKNGSYISNVITVEDLTIIRLLTYPLGKRYGCFVSCWIRE